MLRTAVENGKTDDSSVICHLPIEIGRRQGGVTKPSYVDHFGLLIGREFGGEPFAAFYAPWARALAAEAVNL
jgi:hypothetical protein